MLAFSMMSEMAEDHSREDVGPLSPVLARRAAAVARGVPRGTSVVVRSASGARIMDAEGRSLIDLMSGIGVMNIGHGHPVVVEAIRKQAGELLHVCMHVATYEPYVRVCERLVELLPHGGSTQAMLVNSGAEAVENAVKIARQATGRAGILCFTGGFHGRTLLGMSLTSKVSYKAGCGPFAPEIYRLEYPNPYRRAPGIAAADFARAALEKMREAFLNRVAPGQLAAVLIEPLMGEGGIVPAPVEYLQGLRALCDEHGILLIADEVQSGLCRTGAWASYEHAGIVPDLSTWAKALGGGLPLGAVVGKREVMNAALPGTIGGTFGGNPVSCAAALATLQVMEDEGLNARATVIGARIRERLLDMSTRCAHVGDVRGIGAMMGLELSWHRNPSRPAAALAAAVVAGCLARGVLVIRSGVDGNVLRILPPLVISDDDLDLAMDALAASLVASTQQVPPPPTEAKP